jgi:hypothetical protein
MFFYSLLFLIPKKTCFFILFFSWSPRKHVFLFSSLNFLGTKKSFILSRAYINNNI